MDSAGGQEGQASGSGLRRGLLAWFLWVIASAGGSALGGATFVTQFFGVLFLFAIILGAAQAMVLMRYIPLGCAVTLIWTGVSFCGWLAGWVLVVFVVENIQGLENEVAGFLVWVALAAFQGVALALLVNHTLGGQRSVLALVPLWLVTGVLGAALAMLAGSYLSNALDPPGPSGASSPIGQLVVVIVEQAAAGGIYGASTGLMVAVIVRRLDERRSAGVATNT